MYRQQDSLVGFGAGSTMAMKIYSFAKVDAFGLTGQSRLR
jgi:hypothetical protein